MILIIDNKYQFFWSVIND
ncbi:hypothetical protein c7_R189 [Megavirus courdo7]|uniref:Uncharacterized protein n=1 Tax=Megavirus courdo7 TaxID=1128135 RepID=H2EA32_9VIRU|nr:hypothetical protein c7_R189 [Megavirus courdo7]